MRVRRSPRTVALAVAILVLASSCAGGDADTDTAAAVDAGSEAAVPIEAVTLGDGTVLEYALVTPPEFEPDGTFPVLLALPPGGQTRDLVEATVAGIYRDEAARRGWVVVSPVAPGGVLFFDGSEQHLPELLDRLELGLVPEGGRFYLAGVSNGGRSAFRIAGLEPERFAGLVAFPGYPADAGDEARLVELTDIPVRLYVGGDDPAWVAGSQAAADALSALGGDVELTIVPDEPHIISTLSDGVAIFDDLDEMRSNRSG